MGVLGYQRVIEAKEVGIDFMGSFTMFSVLFLTYLINLFKVKSFLKESIVVILSSMTIFVTILFEIDYASLKKEVANNTKKCKEKAPSPKRVRELTL